MEQLYISCIKLVQFTVELLIFQIEMPNLSQMWRTGDSVMTCENENKITLFLSLPINFSRTSAQLVLHNVTIFSCVLEVSRLAKSTKHD